ncbi:OmpA family protein [Pararhodobacter sp.]|uniref:OmpA family protein n=1 Tax=Pararhodobacter sp. TaxID=2127056 RepID=UPI002B003871|nr:OmpA family protein [Pararhodobacter sp.]
MQISRRALMLGLAAAPLTGCAEAYLGPEVGIHIDEGNFGNPSAHNLLVQTGQLPFAIDLAQRFAAEVPTTITFAFDSARLDGTAIAVLRRQAHWINQFPEVTFRVFGHTDLVGSAAYNQRLGMRRARAVVAYLIRRGVSRSRLEAVVSHGQTQPLIQTTDRERQNRRTVTEVSGFLQSHPMILNGQYAAVVHREYIASATRNPNG